MMGPATAATAGELKSPYFVLRSNYSSLSRCKNKRSAPLILPPTHGRLGGCRIVCGILAQKAMCVS